MNDYISRTIDEYNKLPKSVKQFFAYLTYQCKSKGYCWKTNEQLAVENEVKAKSISRWLKTLRDLGLITSEMTKGVKMTDGSGRADYKRAISISGEWKISGKSQKLKHKNDTQTLQDDVVTMTFSERQNDVDPASKCPSVNVKMTLTQRQNDVDPASKSKEDNIYISKQNINSNKTDIKQEGYTTTKSIPSLKEAPQRERETVVVVSPPVVEVENEVYSNLEDATFNWEVQGKYSKIKIPYRNINIFREIYPDVNIHNSMNEMRVWCELNPEDRPEKTVNAIKLLNKFVKDKSELILKSPKELTREEKRKRDHQLGEEIRLKYINAQLN